MSHVVVIDDLLDCIREELDQLEQKEGESLVFDDEEQCHYALSGVMERAIIDYGYGDEGKRGEDSEGSERADEPGD